MKKLRWYYWEMHPFIVEEFSRGVGAYDPRYLSSRVGCSLASWECFLRKNKHFRRELKEAWAIYKEKKISTYDTAEEVTGLPAGYEVL